MQKNKYASLLILMTLLAWAAPSIAAQSCILKENAPFEEVKTYIQCLDAELIKVTQRRDSWIEKRRYELEAKEKETGNTLVLSLFNSSIFANEAYIKKSCQWRYVLKQPNASLAVIAFKECEIALIEQFTQQLETAL